MKRIFLDTETTGLKVNDDRVVEIAAIAYEDHRRIAPEDGGEYHQYINPQMPMPQEAFKVHGLDDHFLADKPPFAGIADSFIAFISGSELVIHNAEFDKGMLNAELQRLGKAALEDITSGITCSLEWSRKNNYGFASHKLDALCQHFGISLRERRDYHSALVDTRLLGEVFFRMRQQQTSLDIQAPALQIETRGTSITRRPPTAEEIAAHNALLAQMEKESGTTPLYKQLGE